MGFAKVSRDESVLSSETLVLRANYDARLYMFANFFAISLAAAVNLAAAGAEIYIFRYRNA